MCRFAGECPSVDMGCGRAVICPLIPDDNNAYVGPVQGPFLFQSHTEPCSNYSPENEERYGNPCFDSR